MKNIYERMPSHKDVEDINARREANPEYGQVVNAVEGVFKEIGATVIYGSMMSDDGAPSANFQMPAEESVYATPFRDRPA